MKTCGVYSIIVARAKLLFICLYALNIKLFNKIRTINFLCKIYSYKFIAGRFYFTIWIFVIFQRRCRLSFRS